MLHLDKKILTKIIISLVFFFCLIAIAVVMLGVFKVPVPVVP